MGLRYVLVDVLEKVINFTPPFDIKECTFFAAKSWHAGRAELSQIKLSKKCKSIDYQKGACGQCACSAQWALNSEFSSL